MTRISIRALVGLLALVCLHTVSLFPAKAQSLTPTGLYRNGTGYR